MTADVQRELAEALNEAGILGCEEFDPNDLDSGCPDCGDLLRAAAALLPTVQALIADAEKRAAARELRAIGRAGLAASPGAHPVRVPVSYLFDRAAALDPSGAAEGAGR